MSDWEKELMGIMLTVWQRGVTDPPFNSHEAVEIGMEEVRKVIKQERQNMAKSLRKEIIEWKNNQKQDTSFKYEILMAEAGGIGNAVNFILKAIDCYLKK